MKKILLAIMLTIGAAATDYYGIISTVAQAEVDKFRQEFSYYNALVVDTSAGMVAISNIDFNPDHMGWSVGAGLATIHTGYGNGNAYALGTQYAFEYGAMNIKGSYRQSGEYILGSGFVIGF